MEQFPKSPPTGLELRASPEGHPVVKGVKDEVNDPAGEGFDILSHQMEAQQMFPQIFTGTHVINSWMCNDFNGMP